MTPCLMPSTRHRHGQVKTVGDRKFRNCIVQSRNATWLQFCLVSTQFPVCNQDLFANAFTPHTGLDKTDQSQIYWRPLKTVLTCRQFVHTTNKIRQGTTALFSPCRWWELEHHLWPSLIICCNHICQRDVITCYIKERYHSKTLITKTTLMNERDFYIQILILFTKKWKKIVSDVFIVLCT